MKPVRLTSPAEQEMLDAAYYYERQVRRLGQECLSEIDSALRDVKEAPERWPVVRDQVRRRLVHRFPYAVLYRVDPEEIVVLAVMHLHRRPSYWLDRL